jgi:hypothetical protein
MPKPKAPPATLHVNPATNTTYTKRDLTTAPEAFKASLEIMFCHMADMYDVVLTVLAEKYGHSKEEMMATVAAHPSFQSIPRHPVLDSLGYFDEEDVAHVAPAPMCGVTASPAPTAAEAPAPAPTAAMGPGTPQASPTSDPPKKVIIRRKKLKAPTPE